MSLAKPSFPQLQLGNPLADGLVGAWLFYEGANANIYDLSGQGHTAVFQDSNFPWVVGDRGWTIQVGLNVNSFASAAGAGNFIAFPLTVRMRQFLKTFQGNGTAWFGNGVFNTSGWLVNEVTTGSTYQFATYTAGAHSIYAGVLPLSSGNVYDLVVSIDATGNATGFVNGVQDVTAAITAPATTTNPLLLSAAAGSGQIGNIDTAMIWNRALSLADVQRLYINDGGLFTPRRRLFKPGVLPISDTFGNFPTLLQM